MTNIVETTEQETKPVKQMKLKPAIKYIDPSHYDPNENDESECGDEYENEYEKQRDGTLKKLSTRKHTHALIQQEAERVGTIKDRIENLGGLFNILNKTTSREASETIDETKIPKSKIEAVRRIRTIEQETRDRQLKAIELGKINQKLLKGVKNEIKESKNQRNNTRGNNSHNNSSGTDTGTPNGNILDGKEVK